MPDCSCWFFWADAGTFQLQGACLNVILTLYIRVGPLLTLCAVVAAGDVRDLLHGTWGTGWRAFGLWDLQSGTWVVYREKNWNSSHISACHVFMLSNWHVQYTIFQTFDPTHFLCIQLKILKTTTNKNLLKYGVNWNCVYIKVKLTVLLGFPQMMPSLLTTTSPFIRLYSPTTLKCLLSPTFTQLIKS